MSRDIALVASGQADVGVKDDLETGKEDLTEPVLVLSTTEDEAQEVTIRQVAPMVIVLTGATFVTTISIQAVVIILPEITRDLDIPETRQQWIISAYALTSGSFLLLFGKLADVYGKRMIFIAGCLSMAAFSLGSAFSPAEVCLYSMRAFQGLGAAMVIPTAIGIIGYTIPPGRVKNYAFAFYSGGAPTGQAVGNILGGIISQFTSWKVVFLVVAGASFLFGVLAIFLIPKEAPTKSEASKGSQARQIDWLGAFLFTGGSLLALIGLSEGVSQGWKSALVVASLVFAVLMLATFVLWAQVLEGMPDREPLMRMSTFGNLRFSISLIIIALFSAGFTNFLVYSTYFYQDYQLLSSLQTTYRFLPLGICGFITAICSGYMLARIRGNLILACGLTAALTSNVLFAAPLPRGTSYFAFGLPAMALAALGADTVFPCLGLFTTQCLPRHQQALGGAMFQTAGAVGRALFLPVTAAIQKAVQGSAATATTGPPPPTTTAAINEQKHAFLVGLRAVEWFCAACMLACLVLTVAGLRGIGKIGMKKKLGL